ncbi:hypothetical protein Ahy_B10g105658 [Arachis hypogaea]|uniref:Ubiquitin-like protease family profile domain-containing protein n=1 Tax=Arachis hypogaea TaxID=3818 RepID=A0A444X8I5_ARAHY|nr:hypothetical protein Ahy_B10g105658 [Arachis hypogaea]
MLQLARAYDVETNTLRVEAGDIRITAELIGNVFGIPSRDIKLAAGCDKEIPRREPGNMRRMHVRVTGLRSQQCKETEKNRKQTTSEAVNEKGRSKRPRKDADQLPSIKGSTKSQPSYKESDKSYSILSASDDMYEYTPQEYRPVPDSDEDDHMSLARRIRLFQQRPRPHDAEQAEPVCKGNHKSPQQENTQHTDASPHTPPAVHVQLSDYDFDREFDISIVQCPEFEKVLNNVERGCESKAIVMQPLQTVLPNKSSYHTPMTRNDSLASFIDGVRLIYAGLSPNFGEDTRFFDKVVAAKRKWWLFPYCRGGHWWVYAFEVNAKRIAILDNLHSAPIDDERDKLNAYVVRLCEDMASIAIPGFVRNTYGPARSYAKVPMQPINFDCGMCVIKLMERWTEDHELYKWDQDSLSSYRMELMLDIICGQHNVLIQQLTSFLEETVKPVRRNAPRNKKKDDSSLYTAPSTRSLIERAEGLPKGAMRKGRKRLLT